MTENAIQTLKLAKQQFSIKYSGIGEIENKANSVVNMEIMPHFESDFVLNTTAIVVKKLTKLSSKITTIDNLEHLRNLKLADPKLLSNPPIDIILGGAEHAKIIT